MARRSLSVALIVVLAATQCLPQINVEDAYQSTKVDGRATVAPGPHATAAVRLRATGPVILSGSITDGIVLLPPAISFSQARPDAPLHVWDSRARTLLSPRPPPPVA